MKSTFYLNLVL